ncbi:MAG: hypothetical protein HY052_06630 [Proteobacteria bacterium]|nr:hypothetical protein [Pseudomonadota bacterium]
MAILNKVFNHLIFRCVGAVLLGAFVVTLFAALLSLYGESHENIPRVTISKTLRFPENEKMLSDVAAQLAREGAALSTIAPAAGETGQPAPKK